MKAKNIKYTLVLLGCMLLAACAKEEVIFTGNIIGKVTDAVSGESLSGATISLNPTGASKTTGTDGYFGFFNLEPIQYEVQAKKSGYQTNSRMVTVVIGQDISGDIQLTPIAENAIMSLSTSELSFGSKNNSLSFDIKNNGNIRFNWSITGLEKIDWIEITPTKGTVEPGKSNAVKVNLLRNKITEHKEATILINSDKESQALKISADVENLSTKVSLSTNTLNFGTEYSSLTFDVRNIGNAGDVDWEITGIDADWIKVTPTNGTTAMNKSSVVKVDVDRTNLTEGKHTTTIIVNADGESQRVTINAEKSSARYIEVSPSALVLGTSSNGTIALMSHNGVTAYTIQGHEDTKWLSLDRTSGTMLEYNPHEPSTIETINVTVDRTGLAAGDYQVVLRVCSDLKTIEIPVTMTVDESSAPSYDSAKVISCSDNLEFTIKSCTVTGTIATLSYEVKNISNSNIDLQLDGQTSGRSYIFDDRGNNYLFSHEASYLTLGNQENYYRVGTTLPAGVKLKGSVKVKNIDENAALLTNVTIWSYSHQAYLIFKNVPIEGRTPKALEEPQTAGKVTSCSDDFEFTLLDCKRSSSNNVTISFRVKNVTNKPILLELDGQTSGRSYIFDDQGNNYDFNHDASYLTLGTESNYYRVGMTIPGEVFLNGNIVIKDVDEAATKMANITIWSYSHQANLVFENVEIR